MVRRGGTARCAEKSTTVAVLSPDVLRALAYTYCLHAVAAALIDGRCNWPSILKRHLDLCIRTSKLRSFHAPRSNSSTHMHPFEAILSLRARSRRLFSPSITANQFHQLSYMFIAGSQRPLSSTKAGINSSKCEG